MFRSGMSAAVLGLLALALSGCIVHVNDDGDRWDADWKERQEYNRSAIARLEIGMSRADVETRMGEPDFTEAYTRDGAEYRILHYRTQHRHSDGETTADETTPLVFRDGRLEGWGYTLYSKVVEDAEE